MSSIQIAYFVGTYPALTETFIQREIDYLRRHNIEVSVFALRRADNLANGTNRSRMSLDAVYGRPDLFVRGMFSQLYFLLRNPTGYLRCIRLILRQVHEHPILEVAKQLGYLNAAAAFVHVLQERSIHHIHAHFSTATSLALFCHYLSNVSFSMTAHASGDIYTQPRMLAEKMAAASAVVAISRYNREYLNLLTARQYEDKIHVVYNGVDIPESVPSVTENNKLLHIVSLAGLRIFKGFPTLLQALAKVHGAGYRFKCSIVGDGPLRKQLEEESSKLGLDKYVHFLGALEYEDAQRVLKQADVFVLASEIAQDGIRDGIPTVCTEAMAVGIPVVSTYVSGIPELIEDGESGLLVHEKDSDALANAIIRLLEDDNLRGRLAANGRSKVMSEFSVQVTMPKLLDILLPLAEQS